jgi:hypothetical protein
LDGTQTEPREGFGFRRSEIEAKQLAAALAIDTDRDGIATDTMRPLSRTFMYVASITYRPIAFGARLQGRSR